MDNSSMVVDNASMEEHSISSLVIVGSIESSLIYRLPMLEFLLDNQY